MTRRLKPRFLSLLLLIFGISVCDGRTPEARLTRVMADMSGIRTALGAFELDCGHYPSTAEGLNALFARPPNLAMWRGPYMASEAQITDPWKHRYVYVCPGVHNTNGYDLHSCGRDGLTKAGGSDLDDINNWDPSSPHGGYDSNDESWPLLGWIALGIVLVGIMVPSPPDAAVLLKMQGPGRQAATRTQ